jgi:hypothetical protein
MRKILIVILIVLLAATTAFFLTREEEVAPTTPTTTPDNEAVPVTILPINEPAAPAEEEIAVPKLLIDKVVAGFWIDQADRSLYMVTDQGSISSLGPSLVAEELVKAPFSSLVSFSPSPKPPVVLLHGRSPEVENGSVWTIIDPLINKTTLLPLDTTQAAWSPDGKEIALLRRIKGQESLQLFVYTVATAKSRLAGTIPLEDTQLSWPTKDTVILREPPSGSVPSSAFSYSLSKKILNEAIVGALDQTLKFFPGEAEGLRFVGSSTPALLLTDNSGTSIARLSQTTLPEKCTIYRGTIYCGVPLSTAVRRSFAESYRQRATVTQDEIISVVIDPITITGYTSIYQPVMSRQDPLVDVQDPVVFAGALYFINRQDSRIYSLRLPELKNDR